MCGTPSVVRRIVASNVGGTTVVLVVVVVVVVVVDVVLVVVSGEVGSGIDSGPSPGLHATITKAIAARPAAS
jgi:phosphotransferase system  glucose/maltose/N-acetylglucosamine-specific IIC component